MEPIIPFEPMISETIPQEEHWRHEIKWDGTRILTYHNHEGTRLFNRKQRERTFHYPELTNFESYCQAKSVILDGEVIALANNGKPSFHEVMRRDLIQRIERVKDAQRNVSITYMIFDIAFYNGDWVTQQPLSERIDLLNTIITPCQSIQLVSLHPHGESLFKVMQQQDMEGIVSKDLRSTYSIGGKDDRWKKIKNYGDVIAVIGGFTIRGGLVNAVLLGQYDLEGRLWYIGHTGTGKLTIEEWRSLTHILTPTVVNTCPFAEKPQRHKDAHWVNPNLTAKIQYSEWRWQEGRALRQPSIQAFVTAVPQECKLPWI